MCMWVKENVRASCEAVRGDEAVRIRKEACVMCERGFRCEKERDCSVCRKRGLCENGQEVLRGEGMLVGVITANAVVKDDISAA